MRAWLAAMLLAAPAGAAELRLDDAVEEAVVKNLEVRVAVTRLEAADATLTSSRWRFEPTLFARGAYNPSRSETWLESWSVWERRAGQRGGFQIGLRGDLPTGTELGIDWTLRGSDNRLTYDPELNLTDSSGRTVGLLANHDAKARFSALAFRLRQPLLRGISPAFNMAPIRRAELDRDRTDVAQQQAIAEVSARTIRAYWAVSAAEQRGRIEGEHRQLAASLREPAQARVDVGRIAAAELLRIDEIVARRDSNTIAADLEALRARRRMAMMLGEEPGTPRWDADWSAADGLRGDVFPGRDRQASLEAAREGNYSLRRLRFAAEKAQVDQRVARHNVLPDLDLAAVLALQGAGPTEQQALTEVGTAAFPNLQLSLELEVPIPSQQAANRIAAAGKLVEAAEAEIDAAELRVLAAVDAAWFTAEAAQKRIEAGHRRLAAANRRADVARRTFEVDRTSLGETLDAYEDLRRARLAQIDLVREGLEARLQLELLRGSLPEALGIVEPE
jgi:outer membrane protein